MGGDSPTLPARSGHDGAHEQAPTRIGRFAIIERIGAGGMGVVFAAFDAKLDRKIAVKLVRRRQRDEGTAADDAQARLLREAQAMAKLSHPNVIQVYDVGTHDGQVYIAMEFVDGTTLEGWLKERERNWRDILEVFLRAGSGLAAAHSAGMVHRDFKPENVLVGREGRVRVMDFGIARAGPPEEGRTGRFESLSETQLEAALAPMTAQGALLGTPAYMAPEQILSSSVDARADQFSYCVSLYEALYGERPFRGKTVGALLFNVMQAKVKDPPKGRLVPARLRRILLRGLSRKAVDRYPTMDQLLAELSRDPARSRRRWGAGLATGMAIVGVAWGYTSLAGDPARECRAGAAAIDAAWSEARSDAVHGAFTATGVPFAETTFSSVSRQLDAYSARWREMYGDACDSTYAQHEQPEDLLALRQLCLDRRRDELTALAGVLAEADAKVVEQAVIATANLRPLDLCADANRLRNQVAPPGDRKIAAEVQQIRLRLAEATAKSAAGQYQAALELVQLANVAAAETGYRPLVAEALRDRGNLEARLGDYSAAEKTIEEAYWLAMAVGHDEIMARAAADLVNIVGARMARPDDARMWAKHAMSAIERIGELDRLPEAGLHHNLGSALRQAGEYEEAKQHHERALELRERLLEPDDMAIAASLNNLGNVLANLDDLDAAQTYFGRALAIFRELNGDTHPMVAAGLNNVAQLLLLQGKYVEAKEPAERSVVIWEQALGPEHPNVAHPLNTLGLTLARLGDSPAGVAALERALAINRKTFAANHPQLATTQTNLGVVFIDAGDFASARAHLEAALPAARASYGDESEQTAGVKELLSRAMLGEGALEEAAAAADEALAAREKVQGPEHRDLVSSLLARADVDLAVGDVQMAQQRLERALPLAQAHPDARLLARTQFSLARALRLAGAAPQRVDELAEAARQGFVRRGVGTPRDLAAVTAFSNARG